MDKMYMGKLFKPVNIPNYSNYMISKDGDIFSKDRNRLIKHVIDEYGVHKIRLRTDRHCEAHKFRICDLLLKTWNINVDSKHFPNIIQNDAEYNDRINRSEMIFNNKLFKNINLPGYENYMINDIGDVYTKRSGKLMVPKLDKDGYLDVGLYSSIDYKRHSKGVHQLVNCTFNGPPPSDMESPTTDHIDRNKLNNSYTNLRWLSNVDNVLYKNGVINRTKKDDINKICEMFSNGKTVLEVYNYFNKKIPYETIMNINQKTHWKNISDKFSFKPQTMCKDRMERTKEIYETYFRKCLSKEQISKLYKMSIITVREKIRKYFRKFSEHETSICDKQNPNLSGFMNWKDVL